MVAKKSAHVAFRSKAYVVFNPVCQCFLDARAQAAMHTIAANARRLSEDLMLSFRVFMPLLVFTEGCVAHSYCSLTRFT